MADAVTTTVINDGAVNLVVAFTNLSDGTGEAAVKKIDASDFLAENLKIEQVWYNVFGMAVRVLWDAGTDQDALILQGDGHFDFRSVGGVPNKVVGATGDINFTTVGHSANDSYSIVLALRKS